MITTIKVLVPEAYALDAQGRQISKLVDKNTKTQAEMQPQLKAFIDKWASQPLPVINREEFAVA